MPEVEVRMPKLGLTMEGGSVARWLKAPGEAVALDEPILEVETDKAVVEVGSPAAGVLGTRIVDDGEYRAVGDVLGLVVVAGGAGSSTPAPAAVAPAAPSPAAPSPPSAATPPAPPPAQSAHHVPASPATRRMAERLGVDLARVVGTGEGGRVLPEDVEAAAAGAVSGRPLEGVRRLVAERMSASAREIPQVTLHRRAIFDAAEAWIAARRARGERATVTHAVVLAAVQALRAQPRVNAWFRDGLLHEHVAVNLAVAVDTERGLLAPVVKGADGLSASELVSAVSGLAERTRAGRVQPSELEEATFTVSNLGGLGVESFDPLVTPPQVAVLGVGALRRMPRLEEGRLVDQAQLALSLTFDHRVLDGADGARFLEAVAAALGRLSVEAGS